jgi:Na+/H+ antiporter NhaC
LQLKKAIILIILFSAGFAKLQAQTVDISYLSLTNIKTNLSIQNLPDSLDSIELEFQSEARTIIHKVKAEDGEVDTSVVLKNSGNYNVSILGFSRNAAAVRIIPGWFSIIPPLLAIALALIIRQVLVSLVAGIFVGAVFIYNYNPFIAFLRMGDTIIMDALVDEAHMFIIVFTLLIGGAVGIISKNGGTAGIANVITKMANKAKSGMLSSWLMGLVIFFDDYANTLIIGNMMRPITDKLKISREKLSYIVDSTAAPIASLVIISTWIGYELGLIEEGLRAIDSTRNAYDVFLSTIPYRFYPIAAIFFVFLTSFTGRDFGPMYKAEKRARTTGKLVDSDSEVAGLEEDDDSFYRGKKSRFVNGAVPILIILFGTIAGLVYTGLSSLSDQGISDYSIQQVISNSDSYLALLWSSFAACVVAIIMSSWQKILKLSEAVSAWNKGVQSMLFACIILVFAWGISSITTELKTADYLISVLSDAINPIFLPVLVFIICALVSFSTGTSWGTMAIVMPLVIPLAAKMTEVAGIPQMQADTILNGVVSSVLAGSVFGDHCSPIADTTILSSMASKCNHIDHVKTQLPYALLVGVISMFVGDFLTAFGLSPYLAIFIIFTLLIIILLLIGKKVPSVENN